MVPNGWTQQNLKDLCSKISVGLAVSVTPYMSTEGTRLIRNQNIKRDFFNNKSIVYIDDSFAQKNQSKKVKTGDIVAVRTGSNIGEACVVPEEFDGSLTFTTLIIRPHQKKLHPYFFSFHMNSQYGIAEVVRLSAGGAKSNLNSTELKTYQLLVPPIEEQQKIAKILSTWDKAIANTEKLIANSEMQKKALMQQLLTGKKRLLDENGVRFSGEWKRTQLKTFLTESTLRNKNSNIDRVLSITNHSGFVLPEEQFSKRVASNNVENYKIVTNGQFGYNPSRLNVGSFGRLDQYREGVLSPMYVIFNVDTSKVHSDYFLFWMGSGEANQRIKNSTQGSVRESVGFDALCAIPFNLPSISEQEKIAEVLSNADREIELLREKLKHFKQEKKALMQQLLTGKRRVVVN